MTVPISIRWVLSAALIAIVILLSVIPGHARPGDSSFIWLVAATPTLVQKIAHFVIYAAMAWLLTWTLEYVTPRWFRLAIAFTVAVSIGAALEWYQTRVPGRFGSLLDVLLNTSGVAAGLIAALLFL